MFGFDVEIHTKLVWEIRTAVQVRYFFSITEETIHEGIIETLFIPRNLIDFWYTTYVHSIMTYDIIFWGHLTDYERVFKDAKVSNCT